MELLSTGLERPPGAPDRIRLVGEVAYEGGEPRRETYWFEYPSHLEAELSTSGNPWLACLLPMAVTLGEPLRVDAPVSRRLLQGARELMGVWRSWYPGLQKIGLDVVPSGNTGGSSGVEATFFSGGVDSLFTVLRTLSGDATSAGGVGSIPGRQQSGPKELITVRGLDIPLQESSAWERLRSRHGKLARVLGSGFVDVATNLRATRWREADWERMSHGPILAAVVLGLENRYRTARIAATGGYRDLHPWGSHPLVDPLLSTESLEIIHDGAAFTRVDKMRVLAANEAALDALRVCWRSGTDENCAACNKCYRTMLILELLGVLNRCASFPPDRVDLGKASRVYCARPWDFREFRDIRDLAMEEGRTDVAQAANRAMKSSRRVSRRIHFVRRLMQPRIGEDQARHIEERLLKGWIR